MLVCQLSTLEQAQESRKRIGTANRMFAAMFFVTGTGSTGAPASSAEGGARRGERRGQQGQGGKRAGQAA